MRTRNEPLKFRANLEKEIRIGDRSIALLTAALLVMMAAVYAITPAPGDAQANSLTPFGQPYPRLPS